VPVAPGVGRGTVCAACSADVPDGWAADVIAGLHDSMTDGRTGERTDGRTAWRPGGEAADVIAGRASGSGADMAAGGREGGAGEKGDSCLPFFTTRVGEKGDMVSEKRETWCLPN
jgi:hypothetical protein